jgi:hypothetical protein
MKHSFNSHSRTRALRDRGLFIATFLLSTLVLIAAIVPTETSPASERPLPVSLPHAHNDYLHPRPLLDALSYGFVSVEADIHLVDGKLLVAHDLDKTRADRTLESLYLEPLAERARANANRIHPGHEEFFLLIDIKSAASTTYAALRVVLERYEDVLTRFTDSDIQRGAVTVVLSGNRPFDEIAGQRERLCGIDGRLSDLNRLPPMGRMPWISDNWFQHFKWNGQGTMPDNERKKLETLVHQVHAEGRRLRFWAHPDRPEAWRVLREAGVDFINTDRLAALAQFLKGMPDSELPSLRKRVTPTDEGDPL